jgi:hypothetical protein
VSISVAFLQNNPTINVKAFIALGGVGKASYGKPAIILNEEVLYD